LVTLQDAEYGIPALVGPVVGTHVMVGAARGVPLNGVELEFWGVEAESVTLSWKLKGVVDEMVPPVWPVVESIRATPVGRVPVGAQVKGVTPPVALHVTS
jgi:hypothetical protein